ncbi:MAG: hypothetical protein MJY60_04105 [Bacteroidales bacterium]|nr:hypothetical protein [Bacteroidales bacterium]
MVRTGDTVTVRLYGGRKMTGTVIGIGMLDGEQLLFVRNDYGHVAEVFEEELVL